MRGEFDMKSTRNSPVLLFALIGGGLAAVTWAAVRDVQGRKIQRVSERAAKRARATDAEQMEQTAERTVAERNAKYGA